MEGGPASAKPAGEGEEEAHGLVLRPKIRATSAQGILAKTSYELFLLSIS